MTITGNPDGTINIKSIIGEPFFTPFKVKKGDKIWGDQETKELIFSVRKPQWKNVKLLGWVK